MYLQQGYKRFYPEGEAAAHVIGFTTNVDDHGQEGLELAYNNWLAALRGKKQLLKIEKAVLFPQSKHCSSKKQDSIWC